MTDHPTSFVSEPDRPDDPTLPPVAPPSADDATLPPVAHSSADDATLPPCADPESTLAPPGSSPAASSDARAPAGYLIEKELGRGGMGVVYKARSVALQRACALKMILSGVHSGSAEIERFKTEAQALARVQHPGIVQVFEIGDHDGRPFMALEFCSGGSLDGMLAQNPLQPRAAAVLVKALAEAMHAAHSAHVIHRDLKPANVLLTDKGEPKITDFGLAKKLDEAGATRTGSVMGTPSYMPPEQAEGKKEIGPAADIYALGAILYECLAVRPPFRAATPLDTILQVVSEEPVPLRQLNHQAPVDLETIAHKCLQKDPARRYATAQALADDLGRYLNGEPIVARPVGPLERAVKWVRRHALVSALAAAVVLALTVGMAVSSYFAVTANDEASRANREADTARQAEKQALEQQQLALMREREAQFEALRANTARHALHLDLAFREWQKGDLIHAEQLLQDVLPAFRKSWETRYVATLCGRMAPSLEGAGRGIHSVGLSPDARTVLAGYEDGTVLVWDRATQKEKFKRKAAGGTVTSIVFSPDSKTFLSGHEDGNLRLWDAQTGEEKLPPISHGGRVTSVGFSPDSKSLLSGGFNRTVKLWNAATGQLTRTLQGQFFEVRSVAFSPDGQSVLGGTEEGTVRVWETATGRERHVLKGHSGPVSAVAWSADGLSLASGSFDGTLKLWEAQAGREKLAFKGHKGVISSVCFSADGQSVLSVGADQTLTIWDTRTGEAKRTLRGHSREVKGVCAAAEGRTVITGGADGLLRMWDLQVAPAHRTFEGDPARIGRFGPDGQSILSVSPDKRLTLRERQTGRELLTFHAPPGTLYLSVNFSPDGKNIITGSRNGFNPNEAGVVKLWDARSGQVVRTYQGHPKWPTSVCFSPDGRTILCGSDELNFGNPGEVRLWNTDQEAVKLTLRGHTGSVYSVCFDPKGERILSGSADATAKLWNAHTGFEILTLRGHTGSVNGVCCSPDGQTLVTGSSDTLLKLWDAHTGQERLTLRGHTGFVRSVCFSPDGTRILSGGRDATLRIWDARTGQLLLTLPGHNAEVGQVCFSADGNSILSSGLDGKLKWWHAE